MGETTQVRVLVVDSAKPQVKRVRNHFRDMQQLVGGNLELIRVTSEEDTSNGIVVFCDEEANLKGVPENTVPFTIPGMYPAVKLKGPYFFTRMFEGDNVDLTDEDLKMCLELVKPSWA